MVTINFKNNTHYPMKKDYLEDFIKIAEYTVKEKFHIKYDVELSVNIVSKNVIHEINKTYRKIDRVTDVISFEDEEVLKPYNNVITLGDIFICMSKAKMQAKEYGHSIKREVCFLFIHGLLHLLKMDDIRKEDEEKMIAMQESIAKHFDINR